MMKSRISWFNRGLAANFLRRCWPLWCGYFALLLMCFPVNMVDKLRDVQNHKDPGMAQRYKEAFANALEVMRGELEK